MTNPRRRHLILLALAAAVLALAGAGVAVAQTPADDGPPPVSGQQAQQPSLDPLLDRFPIGTGRVRTGTPTAQGADDAESPSNGGSGLLWLVIAVWAGAIIFLIAFGVRALLRWRKGESGTVPSLDPPPGRSKQMTNQATERSPPVTEPSNERGARQPATDDTEGPDRPQTPRPEASPPGEVHDREYAEVGKNVIGILEAAEVAADQIRAEATDAAAGIRKAAEDEAKARLAAAEQEAAKVRSDAEASAQKIRTAAQEQVASRRKEAEAELQNVLADAEAQALVLREAAVEKGRQIELAATERDKALRAQVQPVEANLRRALETFGDITGQLEDVLAELSGPGDVSLIDDLNESARTAEARVDGTSNR